MKNSKTELFYPFWSIAIILCMFVALFAFVFASCASGADDSEADGKTESEQAASADGESTQETDTSTVEAAEETPIPGIVSTTEGEQAADSSVSSARLSETEDMGQGYINAFKFLGDSTTYGLVHYDVVPSSQVWTPASGTLTLSFWDTATIVDWEADSREISIVDAVSAYTPEFLMITLGVNGISFMDEPVFIEYYTNLVNAVMAASPDTNIILNSIYPVSANYPEENGITNAKIDAANTWIEAIANDVGVKYLDSASALKDANGALPDMYQNGDNIHLNSDGFAVVINYIRTHGWQ